MDIFFRSFACLIFSLVMTLTLTLTRIVHAIDGDPSMVVAPGEIPTGGALRSPHGRYLLVMQYDSNLVLYDLVKNRLPLWATNTSGHGVNCFAVMESNGNFVLYDGAHMMKFQTLTFVYSCTGNYLARLQLRGLLCASGREIAGSRRSLGYGH